MTIGIEKCESEHCHCCGGVSAHMIYYKRDGSWEKGHSDQGLSLGFAAERNREI